MSDEADNAKVLWIIPSATHSRVQPEEVKLVRNCPPDQIQAQSGFLNAERTKSMRYQHSDYTTVRQEISCEMLNLSDDLNFLVN